MKPSTMKAAEKHALSAYPNESCGLVVAVGRKEKYIPCRNVYDDPAMGFRPHAEDFMAAADLGTITMVVHSHPDESSHPSGYDRISCEAMKLPWCIISVQADPAMNIPPRVVSNNVIEPSGYEVPLEGREFIFGKQDCLTLVQDFYLRELSIVLPNAPRTDKFWERGEDLYMDNFAKAGFERIPAPSQRGDVIMMAIRSDIVNHAAVWLGDRDHMLHHPYEHLSERTVYGGYWAENTRLFGRKVR